MQNMNVNVLKANAILSLVIDSTGVCKNLLLDDEGFCSLIHKAAHSDKAITESADDLINYVEANY